MFGLYLFKYGILDIPAPDLALYVDYGIMNSQEKHLFFDIIVKKGTVFQQLYNVI